MKNHFLQHKSNVFGCVLDVWNSFDILWTDFRISEETYDLLQEEKTFFRHLPSDLTAQGT